MKKESLTLYEKIHLAICTLLALSRLADDIAEALDTINSEG